MSKFIFKGNNYELHFDADGYGVYGITQNNDDTITFISELKKSHPYRKAFDYAVTNQLSYFIIQDDVWPSRRWNRELTQFIDLSGS